MAKNTIVVKSYNDNREQIVATAVAITPGMLLERTSAGLVQAHSGAGGTISSKIFAMEDVFQGKKITDNYAVSVPVMCILPTSGDRVYAIFDSTSGGSIAIGDKLESAGDGTVRKYTAQASGGAAEATGAIIGTALEAQATPGGRVIVEIF
jgi:hypothetical protein